MPGLPDTNELKRRDGTLKGPGWLGNLKHSNGKTSTELSIEVDGEDIPSLVPTLNKEEVDHMLSGKRPTSEIVRKAVEHARKRRAEGKSPYKEGTFNENAGGLPEKE